MVERRTASAIANRCLTDDERKQIIKQSAVGAYETIDYESAFEVLYKRLKNRNKNQQQELKSSRRRRSKGGDTQKRCPPAEKFLKT
jgi:hypothetical protein